MAASQDRVAVLGFGSSGRRHVSLIRERLPEAEIFVLTSQDLAGNDLQHSKEILDLADFGPNLAVICGVASGRLGAVRALPEELRAVMIEKPLATSLNDGRQVIQELNRRGISAQVGYNLRFAPSLRVFRDHIRNQTLGEVFSVRVETGQYLPDWRPGRDYRTTASATADSGGGVLLELSHEIDYTRWIFGEIEWVSAWHGRQSDLQIDVEDTAYLTLGLRSGPAQRQIMCQMNLDFARRDRVRMVTAICSDGTLRWDGVAMTVEQWVPAEGRWRVCFAESESSETTYARQWDSFYSSAAAGGAAEVTLEDGFAVLAVVEDAHTSLGLQARRVEASAGEFSK